MRATGRQVTIASAQVSAQGQIPLPVKVSAQSEEVSAQRAAEQTLNKVFKAQQMEEQREQVKCQYSQKLNCNWG